MSLRDTLKQELKGLDWNGNGKLDIDDVRDFIEEKLDKQALKVMAATAVLCLVVGFVLGAIFW